MKPTIFAILIFLVSLSAPALAAMAHAPTPQNAIHVVVGTVLGVYESTKTSGGFIIKNHVAVIRIKEIEKGEGLKNGDLLYAHYSTVGWPAGAAPVPYDRGYRGRIPKEGETLRVYLIRQGYTGYGNLEGAFMVVSRNGFEGLRQARKP